MCELSELYARAATAALTDPKYRFAFAHVGPDRQWCFPADLNAKTIASSARHSFADAIAWMADMHIDCALPQMFCPTGVGQYRAMLDMMGIPYLGNSPFQMMLAADKAKTRAVVAAASVRVPAAQLLHDGDEATVSLPAVVKPNSADNSDGIALVRDAADLPRAIAAARKFCDAVLVEAFVEAGREVRCGVIDRGGALECLPLEEYRIDSGDRAIRTRADKLPRDDGGAMTLGATNPAEAWIVDPGDPIVPAVHEAALACHRAMGMRQYSLFDFRVDTAGKVWFLEAGPYCSYSPDSVIVKMRAAGGVSLRTFFAQSLTDLLGRSV